MDEKQAPAGPSAIEDVVVPIRLVELTKMKTRSGGPVVVQCEALDEVVLLELLETLPGEHPKTLRQKQQEKSEEPEKVKRSFKRMSQYGPALIQAGTVLVRADGSEVRPAFYVDDDKKVDGSIPVRLLSQADRVLLIMTLMELGGYLGGAASQGAFHGKNGGRDEGGSGAVEPGEGQRADAVAGDS